MGNLITILATENGPFDINVRVAAGLAAKNCLVARDLHRRQQLVETFQRIEPSTKNELKRGVNLNDYINCTNLFIRNQFYRH